MTRHGGREVLLLHRVPSGGGYWHVVAGSIEPGETPREAAARELQEETGLVAELGESVRVVEPVSARGEPAATDSAADIPVTCYRASAPDEWEPVLDAEHDGHRWCRAHEAAAALIWPQTARALRELVPGADSVPGVQVELREVSGETVRAICNLEVGDDQHGFVAPNALSIAEAHFQPKSWFRAIYADDEPAGFVLTYEDPEGEGYHLWRFMVNGRHQRRGVGRRAMELLLERWRALGAGTASLSVVEGNDGAIGFYESLGFRLTGEREGDELVMRVAFERGV